MTNFATIINKVVWQIASDMNYYYPFGEIIQQFLNRVANVNYTTLQEYVDIYGYGNSSDTVINNRQISVLPLAHPRQIGALGAHSKKWNIAHQNGKKKNKT